MEINIQKNGTECTVSLSGSLDSVTAPQYEKEMKQSIDGINSLILDFANVDYVSSAGLRAILETEKIMQTQGKLLLKNVSEDVMDVFAMTGLDEIFTFE